MTRRSHVVRTDDQGAIATPRVFGGCEIFCASRSSGSSPELLSTVYYVAPIVVSSTHNYQRCFVSATVSSVTMTAGGHMVVELYNQQTSEVITSVVVPSGFPACLTGAIDLPEGDSVLCVHMYPYEWDADGSHGDVKMQVILGQVVSEVGCAGQGTGGCA